MSNRHLEVWAQRLRLRQLERAARRDYSLGTEAFEAQLAQKEAEEMNVSSSGSSSWNQPIHSQDFAQNYLTGITQINRADGFQTWTFPMPVYPPPVSWKPALTPEQVSKLVNEIAALPQPAQAAPTPVVVEPTVDLTVCGRCGSRVDVVNGVCLDCRLVGGIRQ